MSLSFFIFFAFNALIVINFKAFSLEIDFFRKTYIRTESDYLQCLKQRSIDPNSKQFSSINKTHLVPIGTTLKLECFNLCLNVNQSVDNIWVNMFANGLKIRGKSENTNLLPDLSLEVSFDRLNESSTYYCVYNSTVYAIHQITVTDNEPLNLTLIKSESPVVENQTFNVSSNTYSLDIFIDWSDWSDGNRCPIGLRRRLGICKIRIKKYKNTKIDMTFNSSGIPCRSSYLPENIRSIEEIRNQKSRILFSVYRKQCPKKVKFNLTKEELKRKLYLFKDILAQSKIKSVSIGDKVVISCNIAFNTTKHYIWEHYRNIFTKNKYYISPLKVHLRTKGRVKIDLMNNLVINYALKNDSKIYRCYDSISNKTVSLTKLIVRSTVVEIGFWGSTKQYIGTVLILFAIISFGSTIWQNMNLKTKV